MCLRRTAETELTDCGTTANLSSMDAKKIAVLVGLALLGLSWIFPPWYSTDYRGRSQPPVRVSRGFWPIVTPTSWGLSENKLDYERLILIDLAIIVIAGGSFYALSRRVGRE